MNYATIKYYDIANGPGESGLIEKIDQTVGQ